MTIGLTSEHKYKYVRWTFTNQSVDHKPVESWKRGNCKNRGNGGMKEMVFHILVMNESCVRLPARDM